MRKRPHSVSRPILLLLCLTLAAPASKAQRASEVPWMTGARLVKLLGNVDTRDVNWTPESPVRSPGELAKYFDRLNGEFVIGYIYAVHDASEGKAWCWSQYKPKPHELIEDAKYALQRSTDEQLKRNAADVIVEHWRKRFPCPSGAKRRKK